MATDTIMPKTGYITARVDDKLKAQAEKVLRRVGVSTSEVITMLLHQVVLRGGVPFAIEIPNKETQQAMRELEAGKGERYRGSTKDALDEIVRTAK